MKDVIASFLRYVVVALIVAAVTFVLCRLHKPHTPPEPGVIVQTDSTVTQTNTSTIVAPEPAEERIHDTIYIQVPIPSNVESPEPNVESPEPNVESPETEPDSVIYLPIILEQKVYEDPDSTYRAVISGPTIDKYGPKLDTLSVFNKTVTVYQTKTVYVEPSRWSWGVQAGVGYGSGGVTPYVGIGVQYRLWPWSKRNTPGPF